MKMRRAVTVVGAVMGLVVLTVAALLLGRASFTSIANMRQLERVPATEIHAVLPGEINLSGQVERDQKLLQAPDTDTPCLYYRYVVEKRTRDSDGDTKWKTIRDETRFVDFLLVDGSGRIRVRPIDTVTFKVNESFSRRAGDRRYTEYRIEPGEAVFVFGYVVGGGRAPEIRFDRPGYYTPIISERGEARERIGMAGLSVGLCWGGLVCLAFAIGLAAWLLRLHRLLVYFLLLSMVLAIYLAVLGVQMMQADLQSGAERLAQHEAAAQQAIRNTLADASIAWEGAWTELGDAQALAGLGSDAAARINRIRLDLALAVRRFKAQRLAFPERVLAPAWGIAVPVEMPLPSSQQPILDRMSGAFEKAALPPLVGWGIMGAAVLSGLVLVRFGIRKVRNKRCIENIPTSRTTGAAYGLCELKGFVALAEAEEPLTGPLTHVPCIQYHYTIKERRRSGKKTKWVTILDEEQSRPFLCRDANGAIKIDPAGATVYSQHRATKRSGKWRYTESRLELQDPLYAIGACVVDETTGETLKLNKPEDDYPFILSNLTEARVMHKVATTGVVLLNLAFSALLLAGLVLFGLSGSFAATDYLAAALITPVFMTGVMLILHYNDLVFLRERVERNWSNIEVSLKKRHDLIPNLEKMVKAYMAHEAGVQEAMAAMRSSLAQEQGAPRDPDRIGALMASEQQAAVRMLGLMEDYPALKADQNVSLLMAKLVGVENELAMMRTGYNQAVEAYNTRISVIPDVIFAKLFGFRLRTFLQAELEVIRMPADIRDQLRKPAGGDVRSAETPAAEAVVSSSSEAGAEHAAAERSEATEVSDARAVLYALLLHADSEVQQAQLAVIGTQESPAVRDKTSRLIEPVAQEAANPVARLHTAEAWLPKLRGLSPSQHDVFVRIIRQLIEQDQEISLFEYALSKSIDRRLEPAFSESKAQPVRYQDLPRIADPVALVLSRFAQAEEVPAERAQAAFEAGVAALSHETTSDFRYLPAAACSLAAFDAALEELALATEAVKQNIFDACCALIQMGDDYTWDQAMLLAAVADVFGLARPDWLSGTG